MLKMLFTATRSFLKKTFAAAVTFGVKCVNSAGNILIRIANTVIEGWNFFGPKLRRPEATSASTSMWSTMTYTLKQLCVKQFFLFLGGLICCFLLPEESKGDLTWFETMLTSTRDAVKNLLFAASESIRLRFANLFYMKAGGST